MLNSTGGGGDPCVWPLFNDFKEKHIFNLERFLRKT